MDAVAQQAPEPISAAFVAAVTFLIDRLEGGGKLITDSGGLTRWGISQRRYPTVDIEHLPRDRAVELYHADYWREVRGDELPPPLAMAVFDGAVNIGPAGATKLLQRLVGVPDDGKLGPQTLAAVARFRRPAQVEELVALYLGERLRYYHDLAASKPLHVPSLKGWTNRVTRLALECGRLCPRREA